MTDLKIHDMPDIGWLKGPGRYSVTLILDENIKRTTVAPRGYAASWKDNFYFDVHRHSVLQFFVYAEHKIGYHDCVGGAMEEMDTFAQGSRCVSRTLCKYDVHGISHKLHGVIEFTLEFSATLKNAVEYEMDEAVERERNALARMTPHASLLTYSPAAAPYLKWAVKKSAKAALWEPFLNKLQLFTHIVDQLAEVHPYAKMAWNVLSAAHKIILAQADRDSNINRLVNVMDDVYAFVHEAEPLKKVESQKRIVVLMAQQTIECAYFIRDYAKNKNFWTRTFQNVISDVDTRTKQYEAKFTELKTTFQGRAVLQTEIIVLRILDKVENLAAEIDLNDMPYAVGARFDGDKGCLPGTRGNILDDIIDWANDDGDSVPRIYFLSGLAGHGKSAIANTVAQRFHELKRLGSSFFFDKTCQSERRPDNLFSTISRDLADLDRQRKRNLWQVIQGGRALRTTRAAREQFEQFILKPATDLTAIGPIVIVIDALDESGEPSSRKVLLKTLAEETVRLPANFRILVTARPEKDIQQAFSEKKHVVYKHMDTIDMESTKSDISSFVLAQLGEVPNLGRRWPNKAWQRLLVERSEGVFQWASTACLFIKGHGQGGLDPCEQLDTILSLSPRTARSDHLDQLYLEILTCNFGTTNTTVRDRFKTIMGRLLAARELLSVSTLRELRCIDESVDMVEQVLRFLGSLLSGVCQETAPVRPLHSSFGDFLTDPTRSGLFYVNVSQHHRSLAITSLRIMKAGLRFNLCHLETSHIRNVDVPDVAARVVKHIPSHLSYACRFWADHLHSTTFEIEIMDEVREFLFERLLYWLEALSIMEEVSHASKALKHTIDWVQSNEGPADAVVRFLEDAIKFVVAFGAVISQSAPHIYLSALPFAPTESAVAQWFLPRYPLTLSFNAGRASHWPAIQNILEGHTGPVLSVAFSKDGKRIVSGSQDKTIRVWDADTGNMVSGPFEEHTRGVNSVAFSHDSKYIVSCSDDKTIRVVNAETGEVILGPLRGHLSHINSVAFSQDGTRIVSCSDDKTIRIWNTETGDMASRPFEGHTNWVNAVAISWDGKRIASASADQTICLWDAATGDIILGPLYDADAVRTIALSQDGKYIASGSNDNTIRLRNATTGNIVRGPFEGHTHNVRSVVFSEDGQYIVSGSLDKTIRIWSTQTGKMISSPLEGHTDSVMSVAFSSDCKHVVSGSNDKTVRVWDARPRVVMSDLCARHTHWINSVVFSHDGKLIASGSHDKTIRIWNANTGEAISGPYEGHSDHIFSVALSHDGKRIASGSADGTIRVWDVHTGKIAFPPLEGHTNTVRSVAFSPDGKRIVSGSYDTTIMVWDGENGDLIMGPLEGHRKAILSVAFSPDGRHIVSGSWDKTVRVWNAKAGNPMQRLLEGHTSWVSSVAYSPDGKRIASGSGDTTIRVWDAETCAVVLGPLKRHNGPVRAVSFSKDGKYITSGSDDGTIVIWDAGTGVLTSGPLEGHTGVVNAVAFSQDSKCIVSGSVDQTIRVWDVQKEDVVSEHHGAQIISPTVRSMVPNNNIALDQNSPCWAFEDHSRLDNGWILNSASTLLFWVPPWNRVGLWRPRNKVIIGQAPVKLEFSRFVHGESWEQCRKADKLS